MVPRECFGETRGNRAFRQYLRDENHSQLTFRPPSAALNNEILVGNADIDLRLQESPVIFLFNA